MLRAVLPALDEGTVQRMDLLGALADGPEADSSAAVASQEAVEARASAARSSISPPRLRFHHRTVGPRGSRAAPRSSVVDALQARGDRSRGRHQMNHLDPTEPSKECSKCKQTKPLDLFSLGKGLQGRQAYCKGCARQYGLQRAARTEIKARRAETDAADHFSFDKMIERARRAAEKEAPYREAAFAAGLTYVTRSEAIEIGASRYFVGVSCPQGHLALRITSSRACETCRAALMSAYHAKNRTAILDRKHSSYHADVERARRIATAWRIINRERTKATRRRWRARHPDRHKACVRNTNSLRRGAVGTHAAADIRGIWKLQRGRCAYCPAHLGLVRVNVDHIVPIRRGGTNWRSNIQLLCAPCNQRKNAKDPIDFARSLGRLL